MAQLEGHVSFTIAWQCSVIEWYILSPFGLSHFYFYHEQEIKLKVCILGLSCQTNMDKQLKMLIMDCQVMRNLKNAPIIVER
jgi:hypothetical protein